MAQIKINNVEFYYELHGKGDVKLVLIAGMTADHKKWLPIVDVLKHRYQVLIFDNRGIGQTIYDNKSFTLDDLANDVLGLIQSLKITNPYIVGHSMDGAIAQIIAYKAPHIVKGVVLVNTFLKFGNEAKAHFAEICNLYMQPNHHQKIINHIIPWVFSPSFITDELIEAMQITILNEKYLQSASDYKYQFNALIDFDSNAWVHDIKIPVVVIGSSEDKIATLEESKELAKIIPNAVLEIMEGGHASIAEQTDRTDRFVELLSTYCR
jgi:pimeloyl-ACP methyl ester carboxylesterase